MQQNNLYTLCAMSKKELHCILRFLLELNVDPLVNGT